MSETPEMRKYDFSDALRLMKFGACMRRLEWRPNKWIAQRIPDDSLPYLQIILKDGRRAPYTPSACDQYGQDWVHWDSTTAEREDLP